MVRALLVLLLSLELCDAKIAVLESFQADFTQTVSNKEESNVSQKPIEYQGKILAKSPNMALWEYTAPIPKSIYIKGPEVIIYEPLLEQATVSSIKENIDLFHLVGNAKEIRPNLYLSHILEQDYYLSVSSEGVLQSIEFSDKLGNVVNITFKEIVVNEPIDSLLFEFAPKSSVDLLYR